jgi:hypothetical protein
MTTITEIDGKEIIELLTARGIRCDELWFEGNKWCYHGGFVEGESKWALRLNVDGDGRFAQEESLGGFNHKGEWKIPPHAAIEHLAYHGVIEPGEYLIWREW